MNQQSTLYPLPSRTSLLRSTAIAVVVAGILLLIAVLPAEYRIDPTGIGKMLGLYGMSAGSAEPETTAAPAEAPSVSPAAAAPSGTPISNSYVQQSFLPYRSEKMQVTLGADGGAEIKAKMHKGDQFTFHWETTAGAVEFDMHGEEVNAAKDVFTSYWTGDATNGSGTFTAPFEGSHGWYWHNHGTATLTVNVTVSGFFSSLYRP